MKTKIDNRRSQMLTLKEILDVWLPVRTAAVEDMLWALDLSDQFGHNVPIQIHIKDGPTIHSNAAFITSPMVASGYVHSRALLEFLGISAKDGKLIQIQRRRQSDVAIEHYSSSGNPLQKISLDDVYAAINMPKSVVEWALVSSIEVANKFFAHVTTGEVLAMAMDSQVRIALRGVLILLQNHLYGKLGRTEGIPIEKGPVYSCNTRGRSCS